MSRSPCSFNNNVSPAERFISLLAGAYFFVDALAGSKRKYTKAIVGSYLLYRGATGNCVAYTAIGKTKPDIKSRNVNIQVRQLINRPKEELYAFWRDFRNVPLFMDHIKEVKILDERTSEWKAEIPGGIGTVHWESIVIKDRPSELIGWQSAPGASIENAGKVEFLERPGKGTEVHVVISYHAPGGIPGEGTARLINPIFEDILRKDIRRFKDFVEGASLEERSEHLF